MIEGLIVETQIFDLKGINFEYKDGTYNFGFAAKICPTEFHYPDQIAYPEVGVAIDSGKLRLIR